MYTIFDSIQETLQQYFGKTMDIWFSQEENDINIKTISPEFKINSTEPYKGSGK